MDVDRLQEALKEFEKKGKKEANPELDQFLCHVAKTGETIVQWLQFKDYFMYKLEKVMDDFRTAAPEPRGPPNPNVEYIPFDEMKDRILKIVTGFNGTPFTIQRLCELVTDPRRNYTGTDKFLRGVEKNVMVVSCVYPSSEKNNSPSLNRMNGVMFPGNSQNYTDRSNINGPGTPRPLSKSKLSLSSPTTSNGLPDGAENKDSDVPQKDKSHSDSLSPDDESSPSSTVKNKHLEEDPTEEHEVKRLKFDTEDEEEEQAAKSETSSSQTSSEMAEEAESVSESDEKEEEEEEEEKESSDSEHAAEESLMTPSETTAEISDKQTSESETVSNSEEEEEESLQMEESGHCEAESDLHSDGEEAATAESAPDTSKADTECSDTEQPGTFEKSPEIPAETPMENSEEATDVADEPMEQD